MSSEEVCTARLTIHAVRIAMKASLSGDSSSQASEAPRPETPCHVEPGTVVSRNATRPCEENNWAHWGMWQCQLNRSVTWASRSRVSVQS